MRFYYSANPVSTADENKAKTNSLKSLRFIMVLSIVIGMGLLAANEIHFSNLVKPTGSPTTSENEENLRPFGSSLLFGPGMPPTIDGNFCDSVEWGAPIGIDTTGDTPTNTADVVKLWHKRFGDTLYFAWERFTTGAGTSSFNLLFDRDCDGDEDFLIELPWGAIGSSCTEPLTISAVGTPVSGYGSCNGGNSNSTELTTPAMQGSNTCPITVVCNDIPGRGQFAEYYFLISDLVDLCLINPCDCNCGEFTLGNAGSFAGGSFNSAMKDSFNILSPRGLTFKTNSCPVASFTKSADNICLGSIVNFDGTTSIDTFPLYDSIRYMWNFGDGSPTSMLSMPTHQYNTPGTYNVLLTIRDTFGCIDTQAMNIIVFRDTTPPSIMCPNDTSIQCLGNLPPPNLNSITAFDNCSPTNAIIKSFLKDSVNITDSFCINQKIIHRIYQATDTSGNRARCIQKITIRDTISPIIICPNDTLVTCTALVPAVNTSLVSGTDNCLDIVRISHLKDSVSALDSMCLNKKIIYRIYQGRDTCMNTSRCIQRITIRDTIAPIIICPNDTLVTCTALVPAVNTSLVSGTDNCLGTVRISHLKDSVSAVDSTCLNKKIIYRIYQGRDTCMNTSRCIQRITVRDTIAPIIICPNDTLVACTALVPAVNTSLVSGTDNCLGIVRISHLKDSVSTLDSTCLNKKIIYRIYQGRDTCMNTSRCIQRITVRDTIAPIIICPNDTLVTCTALVPAVNTSLVSGTDNCLGIVRISHLKDSVSAVDSICLNKKIIYRIYQGRDTCMNTSLCIQRITVRDTIAPIVICPNDTLVTCTALVPLANISLVLGIDNCLGLVRISHLKDSVSTLDSTCLNQKVIYRIYQGRDTCMNTSRCIQRITVRDTIAPMIICPNDTLVTCTALVPAVNTSLVTGTDNCLGIVRISYVKDSVSSLDSTCLNNKIIYRIYQGRDTCMNTSRCIQRITVRDTIAPIIMCPNDTLVACTALVPAVNTSLVSGTDNCLGIVRISHLKDSVSTLDSTCLNNKIIYRIYQGRDTCMNTSRCIQKITVRDTIAPIIICPNDTLVACTALVPAVNTSLVSGTDNCLGIVRISHLKDSVSTLDSTCLDNKIIYRIYQGRDTCMNTSRCIQRITIRDTIAPIVICPNDTLVTCTALIPSVNTSLVSGMDNCLGVVRISHLKDSVSSQDSTCLNKKIIYRIYQGRDTCMNTSQCIQRITVRDTIAPMIICPNDTLVTCTTLVPPMNTSLVSGTDNCLGIVRISHLKDSVSSLDSTCLNNKIIYRIYQGRDTCMNTSRCIQKITVMDTVVPQLICPADTLISCVDQIPTADIGLVIGTDNCGSTVRIIHLKDSVPASDSTCINGKIIYRIYVGRDTCMNLAQCIQKITVRDTIAPMLDCPDTIFVGCREVLPAAYNLLDSFLVHGGTVEDNCCIDSLSFGLISEMSEILDVRTLITRLYVIKDCCGQSDTCIQILLLTPCIVDLALIKTTDRLVVSEGEVIEFKITVFNQGDEAVEDIKVTDYIPGDFEFDASNLPTWDNSGFPKACRIIEGLLAPGEDTTISIFLKVKAIATNLPEGLYNYAEITAANMNEQPLVDIDSNWDNDPDNDTGGNLFNDDDNNISGNSFLGEDEDDHDGAYVIICGGYICNDQVTVSMDADCEYLVTGDDVLEHPTLPAIHYRVTIKDASGKEVPNATFTRKHIGYCFTYSVYAPACPANSCWGTICVEDKFPPQIDCEPDTVLCFEIGNIPVNLVVNDNCSGPAKVSIASEQFTDFGCDSIHIQGVLTRRLLATDVWGNTRDCEKLYYIRRIHLGDVICPRDTIVDCSLSLVNNVPFSNPTRSGAPKVGGTSLWPNNASCKLTVNYTDEKLEICGGGYKLLRTWIISDWCTQTDTVCKQVIKVQDLTEPVANNKVLPLSTANPHDCYARVKLDTLVVSDCSKVIQTYTYPYLDEATGATKYATGTLPDNVYISSGTTVITVVLTDGCNNRTERTITISVEDKTPPTPVCHEFTRVTIDPATCWSRVSAKDLDNGSHDNCCDVLHFAVAHMDTITYWTNHWHTKLEQEVGKAGYKKDKEKYEALIDDWINCYVFKDVTDFGDCGTNTVVLRVYEACGVPRYDPHVFPCSPHEWFCYNTYMYMADFNFNWFDEGGSKKCNFRPELTSLDKLEDKYDEYEGKGYMLPWFEGAARFEYCSVPFYFPSIQRNDRDAGIEPGSYCTRRLYNDCMVEVLVDDKQIPVVENLRDITVYCDNAPGGNAYARLLCKDGDFYNSWPGQISSGGKIHGYYGGSDHITDEHKATGDGHSGPVVGCGEGDQWSPVYCREWLELDNFDQLGTIDPTTYFSQLVKFDKNRPVRALASNEFSITDNCRLNDESMNMSTIGSINTCGEGWFQRTWKIEDLCGNEVIAIQRVIVKHRSDYEVEFPEDLEVSCNVEDATDTRKTGTPIITDNDCENIGVRYADEISTIDPGDAGDGTGPGFCYKIIRTWTLINWCNYNLDAHKVHPDIIVDDRLRANEDDRACVFRNLKDNGDGYMEYVQIIKVRDTVAPVVSCRDTTICIVDGCTASMNIPLQSTENCGENVFYRLDITRPDGFTETRVNVNSITGNFEAGIYVIRITGRDQCKNEGSCTMRLTINDCKEPTPYCLNGVVTVVMPSTGSIEVWAKDLDKGSSDNCTANGSLRFSFSNNPAEVSRVFRCSDILNGRQHQVEVEIWVTDVSGNQNFCKTYILLQDNGGQPGGICKDTTITVATINGKLYTEDKEGVEFATVEVKDLTGSVGIPAFKTAFDGSYSFNSAPMIGAFSLKALREDNPMNGVSTLDLILIQKHVLGTDRLKTPYKIIAADINNNADVSVLDLIELRKLILGVYDILPNNTSWKFIPISHLFNDIQNPWGYPMEEKFNDMKDDVLPVIRDFVGVKIGDVNSTAVPHSLMGTEVRGNGSGLLLEVEDQLVKKGDEVTVTFRSPNFRGISGWQGTMNFNDHIQFVSLQSGEGKLNMKDEHIGLRWKDQGMITMSWSTNVNGATGIDLDDQQALFGMVFKARETTRLSEALRISSQYTRAESYEGKGELGNLSLRFVEKNGQQVVAKSELYQNYPNPFDQRTVIGIKLAQEGKGILKIYDVTGRTIKSIERDWTKGYHEVWFDRRDIGAAITSAPGVLYYRFESGFFTASKKMIILE